MDLYALTVIFLGPINTDKTSIKSVTAVKR